MKPSTKAVLKAIQSFPHDKPPTLAEVSAIVELSAPTVCYHIKQLRKSGHTIKTAGKRKSSETSRRVNRFSRDLNEILMDAGPKVREALMADLESSLKKARALL